MRFLPFAVCLAVAVLSVAAAPPGKKPMAAPSGTHGFHPAKPLGKGDPYSVTVPVAASADAASVAQKKAIIGGRTRAWAVLSHRLVPQKEWGKLPSLDDAGLERLIRGYTVKDEKRSTTRYVARITYIFNPRAVHHLFRVASIGTPQQPAGKAIMVVAMAPTYDSQSDWAQAIGKAKPAAAQFALVTPIGDSVDQDSLGPLRFGDASWGRVQPAAARVHAGEAVLVRATGPNANHMTVEMRRVGPGRSYSLPPIEIPIAADAPPRDVYATAAKQTEMAIENAWKARGAIDLNEKSKLVAEVRITSPQQWVGLLRKLSNLPQIRGVDLIAMDTGQARIAISYAGAPDQLRATAAQSNLILAQRDGSWWLGSANPTAKTRMGNNGEDADGQ